MNFFNGWLDSPPAGNGKQATATSPTFFFHGKTLPAFLHPLVIYPGVASVCEITTDNFVRPAAQEKVSRTETGSAEIINGDSERCARPLSL